MIGDGSNVYLDLSDVIGILDRILNQVSKDMDDGFPIAIHVGYFSRFAAHHIKFSFANLRLQPPDCFSYSLVNIDSSHNISSFRVSDPRDGQQIFEEPA